MRKIFNIKIDWLIGVERGIGNISALLTAVNIYKINYVVSLVSLSEPLFFKHNGNDLLGVKVVFILDTGHHLMSHPTNIIWLNENISTQYVKL